MQKFELLTYREVRFILYLIFLVYVQKGNLLNSHL